MAIRKSSMARADERLTASADGGQLLEVLLKEQLGAKSKFEELKATLPVAKDLKGVMVEAIASLSGSGWPNGLTADEAADRMADVCIGSCIGSGLAHSHSRVIL